MKKESFILYTFQAETISELSLEQKGALLTAIFEYAAGEQPEIPDQAVRVAFKSIRVQIEHDSKKYTDVCEKRRKAANNRWQSDVKSSKAMQNNANACKCIQSDANNANACKCIQSDANNANAHFAYANDYDNDNDNDNENENENDKPSNEFNKEKDREKEIGAVAPTPKKTLEERERIFREEADKYRQTYGDRIIDEFLTYWTEPTPGRKRMRFEGEKTWEMARRISTWFKNDKKFNHGNKSNDHDAARERREQEIATLMQKYMGGVS